MTGDTQAVSEAEGPSEVDLGTARPTLTRRQKVRRWLRRFSIGALCLVLFTTAASFIFNLATIPPQHLDPSFGHYVHVGGADVHYQRWGDHGAPIVLVPGFLESSIVWSEVGPILGRNHRVYALDLPGHGYTRYTGPMTLRAQAELVDGFVDALSLRGPLLVGHSLGAAIVGSVALAHPAEVGGVVFADGDGLPINLGPRWLRAAILDSPFPTSALRLGNRWTWAAQQLIKSSCGSPCTAVTPALAQQWVRPLGQQSDEHALHELMLNADYGLTPTQISEISVPATVIWGSNDNQGGSLDATVGNLHHPPVHLIEGAGHLTMLADPERFASAVEAAAGN